VRGIPAVVLSSDKCWFTLPSFDAGETCSAWHAAQDLLAAHLDAKHITDTNSAHNIHVENPKLVINSVREVVAAARKKSCALGAKNRGQCVKALKHAR
jgi:hypothetical protein